MPKFDDESDRKLCMVLVTANLDMATAVGVMGNAALQEGIELHIFFSFWGLDAIIDRKMDKLKIEPLANPGMEMPGIKTGMPNILAGLPGMRALATKMMHGEMEKLGVPPTREFFQMLADAGAHFHACRLTFDMLGLSEDDLFDEVEDVISASDFMELADGAQIIFIS